MKRSWPSLIALGVVCVAVFPAFDGGFLADDFFMGERIAARSVESPGISAAVRDAFLYRWTSHFDVFRPLTIITLQCDYALFGADPHFHHLTNVLLWLLASTIAAAVSLRVAGASGAWLRAVAIMTFGAWPAGVEAVGWLVAREDLLCGLAGLCAMWLLLKHPGRPLLADLALTGAFLAKETAVVLPFVLIWTDAALDVTGSGRHLPRRLLDAMRRHAASLGILAGYLGLRLYLFGALGGAYNDRPYSSYLFTEDAVPRIASAILDSLHRLVIPVNAVMLESVVGWSPLVVTAVILAILAALVLLAAKAWVKSDARVPLAAAGWCLFPLLLLVIPLDGVEASMAKSRFLVIPMVGWHLILVLLISRAWVRSPGWALMLAVALVVCGMLLWHLNLTAFRLAGERARSIIAGVTDLVPGSGPALLFGLEPPGEVSGVHPDLGELAGSHVLSAGLFHATRPPFLSDRTITLTPVEPPTIPQFDERIRGLARPYLLRYRPVPIGPGFELLAEGGRMGPPPELSPPHGARVPPSWVPRFDITVARGPVRMADHVTVHLVEPLGNRARARLEWSPSDSSPCRVTVLGEAFSLVRDGEVIMTPLTAEVLAHLPHQIFVWWVEFHEGDRLLLRSPYQVVRVVGP